MFNSIKTKLLVAMLVLSLVPFLILSSLSYFNSKQVIENIVMNNLTAIREVKATQIEDYFSLINKQILTMAEDDMIISATKKFKDEFHVVSEGVGDSEIDKYKSSMKTYLSDEFLPRLNENLYVDKTVSEFTSNDKETIILQYNYISNNENEVGNKHALDKASSNLGYNEIHNKYHHIIRHYLEEFEYYDIFIVDDKTGHIIYSVFKEADYATSLIDGPYKSSNIADVYRKALEINSGEFVIEDFAFYDPSYSAPASFIASPIFEGNDRVGVLIFQMPVDAINNIMTSGEDWSNVGLGLSGETYLVGSDNFARSSSRFLIEDKEGYLKALKDGGVDNVILDEIDHLDTSILLQPINSQSSIDAINGKTGTTIIPDYRDIKVLSSYKPLKLDGLDYAILSEIDESEAFTSIKTLGLIIIIMGLITTGIVVSLSLLISFRLTKPLEESTKILKDISEGEGDLTKRITVKSEDEIGQMGKWFNLFVSKLVDIIRELVGTSDELKETVVEFDDMMDDSNNNIKDIINSIENVNDSLQNNASISEETSASILELSDTAAVIYKQTLEATKNSDKVNGAIKTGQVSIDDAVKAIEDLKLNSKNVSHVLGGLQVSADKIGDVVNIIQSISEQTNLLALNASIEAARAGAHGKGFAVVAEEVRKLAEESNSSTESIREMIKTIQDSMEETYKIINDEKTLIDVSVEKSTETKSQFDLISETVVRINNDIETITKSSELQSSIADDMSIAIENLAHSTQSNAEAVSVITTKANDQLEIIHHIEEGN